MISKFTFISDCLFLGGGRGGGLSERRRRDGNSMDKAFVSK